MKTSVLFSVAFFAFYSSVVSGVHDNRDNNVTVEILHESSAYFRPSEASRLFYEFQPQDVIKIEAVSDSGWLGFDPGIAQAANTGVFRFRWLKNDSSVALRGDTSCLLKFSSPDPFLTYNMFFEGVKIYSEKDSFSIPLFSALCGDYAEIISPIDEDWIEVDFSRGFPSMDLKGWIEKSDLNVNY
ncbi:hypothetical protein JXA84_01205 [candidate division WOR-3 bacterium]|nr:hypothetical protein [candidate division WOR-3 bacterium]